MKNTSMQVSLELVGDEFDINYITELLNREPDYQLKKGDVIKLTKRESPYTIWRISVKESESLDLDTHTNPIFDFVERNLEGFKLIAKEIKADWFIRIYMTIRNGRSPSIGFTPRQVELANIIKADIDFDLYVHDFCPGDDVYTGSCGRD